MIYEFRAGTRAPRGVSAQMIMEERDRLAKDYGTVSVSIAATAVERTPQEYPGLAGFLTWDPKVAIRKLHEREVGYAFASVVVRQITPEQVLPVRALVTLSGKRIEPVWERVEFVLQDFDSRAQLFAEIEEDLRQVADKLGEFRKLDTALRAKEPHATAGVAR